jgi:ABC-type lipoprotein release transport system permease subunit
VLAGLACGVVAAIGLAAVIDRLTKGELPIRLEDPLAFWVVPMILAVVVLLAIIVPARRATGASPVQALRQD